MNDANEILIALKEHRAETRQDMHELRGAVVKIADAASEMGKTMARSEERHVQHEDANKRINRSLDDHEARIRIIESEAPIVDKQKHNSEDIESLKVQMLTGKSSVTGGWRVITVIGALFLGAVALASLLVKASA